MHILIVAALVCAPSFAPASAGGALASVRQDPPADNREEVKAMIAELEAHAALRGKEDTEAVAVIDRLVQTFAECGPKDRAAIVKSLDKCFKEKRLEDENGVPDNKLYLAATTALGEMAPESVDVMMSWIGHKTHKKDVALQRLLILKLGKTKQEKARKPLIKLLDDHSPPIQAAAAEALGEYDALPLDDRKATFEELLKLIMIAKSDYDADTSNAIARERYDTVAAPIITSLQRLSKHTEHDPLEWQRWWNKNKKADWDNLDS